MNNIPQEHEEKMKKLYSGYFNPNNVVIKEITKQLRDNQEIACIYFINSPCQTREGIGYFIHRMNLVDGDLQFFRDIVFFDSKNVFQSKNDLIISAVTMTGFNIEDFLDYHLKFLIGQHDDQKDILKIKDVLFFEELNIYSLIIKRSNPHNSMINEIVGDTIFLNKVL